MVSDLVVYEEVTIIISVDLVVFNIVSLKWMNL